MATPASSEPDRRLWHVGALFAVGGAWELAGRLSGGLLFPSATGTFVALVRLTTSGEFWEALWISNQAFLLGFVSALIAGVALGLALTRSTRLDRWLDFYLGVLIVVPKTALMPLVIMTLGLGLLSRSLVVFTFAFPTIVVTVRAGAREVEQRLLTMARAFCASEIQIWRRVLVPGALPAVMTALRLGLAQAVAGMVTVEILLIAVGIGRLIMSFRTSFDAASLYAAVVVVVTEAVLLIRFATALERRFGSWTGTEAIE